MKILFSEEESYYRNLGLVDIDNVSFTFDGMKLYKQKESWLTQNFDMFVCFMYTLPHNCILTEKFKRSNCPTVLVIDGIYDYANSNSNPMVKKYHLELYQHIQQDFILSVDHRLSSFFHPSKKHIGYRPKHILAYNKFTEFSSVEKKVLITTANSAYFNDVEYQNLIDIINKTIFVFDSNNIKYDFRIFDENILKDIIIKDGCKNVVDCSFEDILGKYDHFVTTPSSIAISAINNRKAVALLLYRDEPTFISSGWSFTSKKTISAALSSFLNMDEPRMRYQERFVNCFEQERSISDALSMVAKNIDSFSSSNSDSTSEEYLIRSYENMLNSKFNINLEYGSRKIYTRFKSFRFIKFLRKKLR